MVLLAMDASGLFGITKYTDGFIHDFFVQFHHHPWNGLRFWDLIQPGFMFIAGTAMAFSLNKQYANGRSWHDSFIKALKRSGWLFFWGVLDYAVRTDGLSFELWNVLTQLSFTMLIAFLVFRWSYLQQILFCVGLLLLGGCSWGISYENSYKIIGKSCKKDGTLNRISSCKYRK